MANSIVKNQPVTIIKEEDYVRPEFTADNYFAQLEWNDEIANNKQGYMAVDIMDMKDFYDAGGYAFVNDYRAELGAIDAAYDRALPGYGVRGEQMAQGGLTGAGYGDYMMGQAYLARAQGQALARQNIMANSNSFRSAYNQYVTQQLQQRENNLMTVVEKAYTADMDAANFIHVATALGIPKEDAERGKQILMSYQMGFGSPTDAATKAQEKAEADERAANPYGLTVNEQTAADSLYQQAMAGLYGGTVTDPTTGKEVDIGQYATLDAALSAYKGTIHDPDGLIMEAVRQKVIESTVTDVEARLSVSGGYVSKAELDRLAEYGSLGPDGKNGETYKNFLAQAQEKTYMSVFSAIEAGDRSLYERLLTENGYDMSQIPDENVAEIALSIAEQMMKNGDISREQYVKIKTQDDKNGLAEAENGKELLASIVISYNNREDTNNAAEVFDDLTVSRLDNKATLEISNGQTVCKVSTKKIAKNSIAKKLDKIDLANSTSIVWYDGSLYMYQPSAWNAENKNEEGWYLMEVYPVELYESNGDKNTRAAIGLVLENKISLMDFGVGFLPNLR